MNEHFRSPQTLVRRFVARRTLRSSLTLGLILAFYSYAKASGFIKTYPTAAARQKLAETLGSNVGIEALLGSAHHIETIAGYAVWNFLCLIAAAGAVWALLIATKTFRGEEDSGHWELFLAGQTTARRAACNALLGLASGLGIIYICLFLGIKAIGSIHGADFTTGASLFFTLALVAGAAEFMAVGALASQLMPVRSRATGLSAAVFGVFYMIRLTADSTNAHWLLDISPLGWIEKLQPMYNSQPLWLLPIGIFIAVLVGLTIYLAGRRDLGEGVFVDKDTAKPRTRLLGSPLGAAVRLTRSATLGWLAAVGITAFLYGLLAKGVAQALNKPSSAIKDLNRLTQASHVTTLSAEAFMGITFLLIMLLATFYAANAVGQIRNDEAQGYVDNFLVRPVSRLRWLSGRILLVTLIVVIIGLLSGLASWVGQASQHGGLAFHVLLLAGVNVMAPVLLIMGIAVFAFGAFPRRTGLLTYGAIGWSFLVVMLSSGLNLNHWLLDTSILHQVALAPAVSANWTTDAVMVAIGLLLCSIGALRFNNRDLQGN